MRKRVMRLAIIAIAVAMVSQFSASGLDVVGTSTSVPATAPYVDGRIEENIGPDGVVRVIVGVRTGAPFGAERADEVRAAQAEALSQLTGTSHKVVRSFEPAPFMTMDVGADAIRGLRRSPAVESIVLNEEFAPTLAETADIVRFDYAYRAGLKGSGTVVAVVDTGVERYHPFIQGAVVGEACFAQGGCPNGATEQIGSGSAVPCTFPNCTHGTHVAGIVMGRGGPWVSPYGVASQARVMPIQVYSESESCGGGEPAPTAVAGGTTTCARTNLDDVGAALRYVYERRAAYKFAAVNLSLGGGSYSSSDECSANLSLLSWYVQNLRTSGVPTVVSSGNEGRTDGISSPACLASAISVGATTDDDTVWEDSNSSSQLTLLAPGVDVVSSLVGGSYGPKRGTSMAAPHVAGAFAVLKSWAPEVSVETALSHLRSTGVPIRDGRNGITTPRIDLTRAMDSIGSMRIADATITESGKGVVLKVTLTRPHATTVSAMYTTVDGTAKAPGDYTARWGRVYISPGQTYAYISVPTIDDSYWEKAETFSVQLSKPLGVKVSKSVGVVTIGANDSIYTPGPAPYEGDAGKVS